MCLMDEDVILQDLTVGIWTINCDGITCTPRNLPQRHIGRSMIFATMSVGSEVIWDLPIHLAFKTWMNQKDMINLMKALSIYRLLYPHPTDIEDISEMDNKSLWLGLAVLDNRDCIGDFF